MAYPSFIQYIQNSEPVVASVANRASQALDKRTESLRERMDAAELGQALAFYDVPLHEDTVVGTPVYWDSENNLFSPAVAECAIDSTTATMDMTKRAYCIGLVQKKTSSVSGDVVISGIVDMPELYTLMGATGSGVLYLGTEEGSLTFNPTGLRIPVGYVLGCIGACDSHYRVLIRPNALEVATHSHFSIDLYTDNASSLTTIHGWHTATASDTDAPTGAKYVYNLSADTRLSPLFPPTPLTAVSCFVDWGTAGESVGSKEITINQASSLIKTTHKGIYWMSNVTTPFNVSRLTLHFSKIDYSTRGSSVTSLQPATGQPFQFVNCDGDTASSGDLFAKFTLNADPITSTDTSGTALLGINNNWKQEKITTINGIRSDSGRAVVTGTGTVSYNNLEYKKGLITLSVSSFPPNYELVPQVLRMGNTLERDYNGIQYIGLPSGRDSQVVAKLEVPGNFASSSTAITFKLRLLMLAAISGTYPTLNITVSRIQRPITAAVNVSTLAPQSLTYTSVGTVAAGTAFEIETGTTTVYSGDTLIVTVARPTSATAYLSDVGIIRLNGVLNL